MWKIGIITLEDVFEELLQVASTCTNHILYVSLVAKTEIEWIICNQLTYALIFIIFPFSLCQLDGIVVRYWCIKENTIVALRMKKIC